jgi:hypothetical protein
MDSFLLCCLPCVFPHAQPQCTQFCSALQAVPVFGAHIIHIEEKSMKVTLTKLVKNTTATFVCYRDGDLWYRITVEGSTEPAIFEFPVPVADTGTGIFTAEIKAITLMRWIRKQLDRIEKGQWG